MMKIFNAAQNNYLKKLELFLDKRKIDQKNNTNTVKKILSDVKKKRRFSSFEIRKKFSQIKTNSKKIKFSKKINIISKKLDKVSKINRSCIQ